MRREAATRGAAGSTSVPRTRPLHAISPARHHSPCPFSSRRQMRTRPRWRPAGRRRSSRRCPGSSREGREGATARVIARLLQRFGAADTKARRLVAIPYDPVHLVARVSRRPQSYSPGDPGLRNGGAISWSRPRPAGHEPAPNHPALQFTHPLVSRTDSIRFALEVRPGGTGWRVRPPPPGRGESDAALRHRSARAPPRTGVAISR